MERRLLLLGGRPETPIEEDEVRDLLRQANEIRQKQTRLDAHAENLMARVDMQGNGSLWIGPHLLEVQRMRMNGERIKVLRVDGAERLRTVEGVRTERN